MTTTSMVGPPPSDEDTSRSGIAHEVGQTIREAIQDWPKTLRLSWLVVAIAVSYYLLSR